MWGKEIVNEYHCLYIRVHKDFVKQGLPSKSAFTNTPKEGDNLSSVGVNIALPESSRSLIGKQINFFRKI